MLARSDRWLGIALAALLVVPQPARAQGGAAPSPLIEAYNESGHELFRQIAKEPGNVVMSPYSIGSAMAMVLSGARGETQAEMLKVLRHRLSADAIDAANAAALASLAAHYAADDKADKPVLRIANALMMLREATVRPEFEKTIRTDYRGEVFFKATPDMINAWVKSKTEGKIPVILEKLDPDSSHVLLNAVYFNAPWLHSFPANATRERDFHLTATETAAVPMMSKQDELALVSEPGFAAVRLPYAPDGLAMIVLRPDEIDGLTALIARLDVPALQRLLAQLRTAERRSVQLAMPRFKAEFRAGLIPPFKALDLRKIFDPSGADLSGMLGTGHAPAALDQIEHRAVIDVTEKGTEAAAATAAVVVTRTMRAGEVSQFVVDRPFFFLIVDDKAGAILFQGRISDPRS